MDIEKQYIEKWVVLLEIDDNEGIEVTYPNGTSKLLFNEDKEELYCLVDSDFKSAYIEQKENRVFIDKIYLNLNSIEKLVLEII